METQTTKAARSQYGKGKQEEPKGQQPDQPEKCHLCGQRGHGKRAPPTPAKQPAQRTGKLMVTVVGQTISTLSVSTKRKRNTTRLTTHLTRRVPHLIHYAPQQP